MPPRTSHLVFFVAVALVGTTHASAAAPKIVRFNEHVRPILSNNCFACHGPDAKRREADLRLDEREAAIEYGAIVAGDPEASSLIERIATDDPDAQMPPPHSKKPRLSEEQIAILRAWIEQGAEYEGHWAFLPVTRPQPPEVKNAAWVANPIDRFILARLEERGIAPSPEADRATLIRRVSLDLTGLLPTPAEVDAFEDDPSPDAYGRLVERFLSSPHYGERWGRHWLDQARYADSNGYTIDSVRTMWPYRDWVLRALNDDMPFDQFTIEQLAGDLLPHPTKSQLVATAFHRNTLINEEGGVDPRQYRHEAVVDRVNTTGAVWLGLTVGCAQCHTHKFDPISHREYYELFAFFNQTADVNNKGPTVTVAEGEMLGVPPAASTADWDAQLAQRQAVWENEVRAKLDDPAPPPVSWRPARLVQYETKGGAGFQPLEDGSLLSDQRGAASDSYRLVITTDLPKVAAVRLRVLTHAALPKNGPGTAANGNFVLTDFTAHRSGQKLEFGSAFADHEQPKFPATGAIDGDSKTGWAINVGPGSKAVMNADHEAVFVFKEPVALADDLLEIQLFHDLHEDYLIGRFALDVTEHAPTPPLVKDDALLAALRTDTDKRTAAQAKLAREAFERSDPVARRLRQERDAAAAQTAAVMVMKEIDAPRETFVYLRGDFLRPDAELGPLQPDVLDVAAPALPEGARRTRLDLARWLVHPENPLTPRVTMNRVWMRYFGRGLVETEEDFGTQGAPPTHPELLDWLASEFIARDWSLKAMHRAIVTSATYRQSSTARPDLLETDPRNLLLARQERVRLEAEIVRDAALSASGLLSRELGGPSVRPPQPEGVYAFTQTAKPWTPDEGADRFRRAFYTLFIRSAPYPLFTTFDAPDFQTVCTRRIRSNTPLQALTVANDEAFLEIAQGLALRVLREIPGEPSDPHVRRVFRLCLGREPMPNEFAVLKAYHARQIVDFREHPERARQFLISSQLVGDAPLEVVAALTAVSRAVLNTDNFITRE